MENARTERLLTAGPKYGQILASTFAKRSKPRPNLAASRANPVRLRMANVAGGVSALDSRELGLEAIESLPADTPQGGVEAAEDGRILSPAELWEFLLFVSEENKNVQDRISTNPFHPPPLPHNPDFSSTFGRSLTHLDPPSLPPLGGEGNPFEFDVNPPPSPRAKASKTSKPKRKKSRKRKAVDAADDSSLTSTSTSVGPSSSNVSFTTQKPQHPISVSTYALDGSATSKLSSITSLTLGSWPSISHSALRSLSLTLGPSLKHVSFRNCRNLTNDMLEGFGCRLVSLESLDLQGCKSIGDQACRAFSDFCGLTLTSVDLSHCSLLSHDALGWISGCLGHNKPGCRNLRSIDVSDCRSINDNGLEYLSKGCRKLKYAAFRNDTRVTSKGVTKVAEGCRHLRVLNVENCDQVDNKGLIALGMNCKELRSLNFSRVSSITDHGLAALGLGCCRLQALNIAGAKKVSEAGLCAIAQHCPNLATLNCGGCELVTRNGLLALIEGLGYVAEARTFFGFIPVKDSTNVKLKAQQEIIETDAATKIQNAWHNLIIRREAKKMVRFLKRDEAALIIQLSFQRYLKRKVHWLRRYHYHRNLACIELQRCIRGYWGRKRATVLKEWWDDLKRNEHYAVMLQAKARGHHVRIHDKLVAPALVVLHEEWEQARKNGAATKLQAAVRRMLAKFRVRGWREVVVQRLCDVDISILVLQRTVRAYNARCELARLLHYAEITRKLRDRAAIRMQTLYRIAEGKYGGLMRGEEMARMKRIRNRACLHVQRVFRGFLGREAKRATMYEHETDMKSALLIQRVFRSTRILHWKDIKMNKVAAFVYKRQQLELQERQRCADIRNLQRLEGAQKDSASEEETHVDVNDLWQEMWDDTLQKPYWHNPSLQTNTYERPLVYAFERSLIGLKVRIYWPMNDEYFTGKVTKYNKTKKRWRVNYKDGDHEWLDFEIEHERVQVFSDGSWKMFKLYQPPVMDLMKGKIRARKEGEKEMNNKKKIAESWAFLGFDEENERSRYHSMLVDETRLNREGVIFDNWVIKSEKDSAKWVYYNTVDEKTMEWDQPDPRLSPAEDTEIMKLFKIQLISDLRFGSYFCRALVDEYFAVEDVEQKRKILARLKKDSASKKMAIALVNASKVWEPKEFNEIEELVECTSLQKVISELLDAAEKTEWGMREVRRGLLKMGEKKATICPKCHYEVEDVSATYCAVCGFKLWASAAGQESMTEEEKTEQRKLLHRKTDSSMRKVRATMRATREFRSTQKLEFDVSQLDLSGSDDDEELGLKDNEEKKDVEDKNDVEEKKQEVDLEVENAALEGGVNEDEAKAKKKVKNKRKTAGFRRESQGMIEVKVFDDSKG